jgi:preprotein translocase subunit SecB
MIHQSPLQLDFTFFPVVRVEAIPGFGESDAKPSYDFQLEVVPRTTPLDKTNLQWEAYLEVRTKAEAGVPYRFEIHAYGRFHLPDDAPPDRRVGFVESNAPAILYAGIREMLLNLTMRGPYPRVQLAPLQFLPDNAKGLAHGD